MIKQKLKDEQIQALKKGNKLELNVIRYILSQIQNKEIDKRTELTDDEVISVLKRIRNDLKESIEAFQKAGRQELVDEYSKQLEVVVPYLPEEISDEELKTAIKAIIEKNKPVSKAIIGICIKELKSKADPSRIINMLKLLTDKS